MTTSTTSLRKMRYSITSSPDSTNRPAVLWLRQKQSNGARIYWLQESVWPHRPWSTSNETECLRDMWSRTGLTTQLSEWTQTTRRHWLMSLFPKNWDGWSTTREHTEPHYVSPSHQPYLPISHPWQLSVLPLASMRITPFSVSHPTWQVDFLASH